MKTFKNMAAQGDMLIRRVESLPDCVVEIKAESGSYVLAHSETGHDHIVNEKTGVKFYQHANDNFIAYLVVDNDACVEHMRGFDTHETIGFNPGIYEIRRQREYIQEGFRRVQD